MGAHKNHQKEDYKRMRAVVFWLHDNKCFVSKTVRNDLECHHCDHDSTNNKLLNLVPISNDVHKLITKSKGYLEITPDQIIKLLQDKIDYYKTLL